MRNFFTVENTLSRIYIWCTLILLSLFAPWYLFTLALWVAMVIDVVITMEFIDKND
jgi:hypothetical protein